MSNFWAILTKPDNLPVAVMVLALGFLLWVALRQALAHDRLTDEGRPEEIARKMRR